MRPLVCTNILLTAKIRSIANIQKKAKAITINMTFIVILLKTYTYIYIQYAEKQTTALYILL